MPVTVKAKASDATDAVVTRGPGAPRGGPAPSPDPTLQDSLEKGMDTQGNAVATENSNNAGSSDRGAWPPDAPLDASGTTAGTQSPANTSAASLRQTAALQVTTITHTVADIPADAETAMQRLRADFARAHTLISNTGHFAALPIEELGRLIATMSTWMGVIRAAPK